jgi:hypothetical protein
MIIKERMVTLTFIRYIIQTCEVTLNFLYDVINPLQLKCSIVVLFIISA